MKNKLFTYMVCGLMSIVITSCSEDLDSPVLPQPSEFKLPASQDLDADVLFGVWSKTTATGKTNSSYFEQRYEVAFQNVEDGEAVFSHWFTDATTEIGDSTVNYEYTYTFDGKNLTLTPKAAYALQGAAIIKGLSVGNQKILLYTEENGRVDSICTLERTADPAPSVTAVDRTLPQVGEKVTISGRNLQFVDHIYLPTEQGELEVTDFEKGSKQISFILPEGDYAPGSIRCQSTGSHLSCYSPAYMFRDDCVFFHTFSTNGTKAPYTGSEFEYTIKSMGTLMSGAKNLTMENLPAGHCLEGTNVKSPDAFLSFFGNKPLASWALATKTDDKKGYIRFSSGDRFLYVIDQNAKQDVKASTPCADLALQMDVYVTADGEPVWNTGYISYRLNKDQSSLTSSVVANVAMWTEEEPMSFADGWKTLTIPLSAFSMTRSSSTATLGGLINSLLSSNLQTIFTLVNYPLDALHPAKEVSNFQFNIANIRLVPYAIPNSTKE